MSCNELILLSTDPDDIAILEGPGVQSVNGKVGKVVLDAGDFAYDDTKEYSAGSVGAELKELSQKEIDVDSALSDTSTNPVQNKVVKKEVDDLKDNLNDKADVIISTASGSIAHFEDGAEANAVSVIAHIEPVQDLHGYDSPWPAGGGVNILDPNIKFTAGTYYGGAVLSTSDGYNVTMTGTPTESGNIITNSIPTADAVVMPAGTYTSTGAIFSTYKPDGSWYANRQIGTWTADSDFIIRQAYIQAVANTPVSGSRFISLVKGSTAPTAWTPYSNICPISGFTGMDVYVSPTTDSQDGTTYPSTFPTEAGEVFGGYVDAVKGKLVVNRAKSTVLSSMTFGTVESSGHGWYIARSSIAPLNTGENYDTGIICDKLPTAIGASSLAQNLVFVNTSGQIRINTAQVFNTKEDMLSYFGDSIDIVYPIEPITYQLTPQQITTLLGINNIWSDCNGNTDVEYKADTKLYIEQLTKPTEDDMTANANIASGKFFMVGNRLFLSTSAIASGDTINPGTNCTELSLADALNNLN